MKYLTYLLFFAFATPLFAASSVYEGFDAPKKPLPFGSGSANSGQTSQGWLSDWQVSEGKASVLPADLAIEGLSSAPGLASSKGKAVVMRQLAETFTGDVYGSFRVRGSNFKPNSMMGLMFSLPDAEPKAPKTSFLTFLATRWGSDIGAIVIGGKPVKVELGEAVGAKETALVLWKIDNLPEPGKRSDQVIQMWVLNESQAAHFAGMGMKEKALNKANAGKEPDQVMQYVRVVTRGSKLTLVKGLVVSCFSAEVPKAEFDEIRISSESLADAAGVGQASSIR